MPIPPEHAHRYIYHFTHADNLPSILRHGFLCNNHPDFPKSACRSVAEQGIQERRAKMAVTCGPGGTVHDYVPLYFGSLSPMLLAVVNKKNVDQMEILYFEFPISIIGRADVVFTDASANTEIPPTFYSDPADLKHLNWVEIDSLKWSSATDILKHQRMAEILIPSSLRLQDAARVVVWHQGMKEHVSEIVKKAGVPFPDIHCESSDRRHWYTKFFSDGEELESLVTGPRAIAHRYKRACKEIQKIGQRTDAPFGTPGRLLEALRENFGCLPQTAELVGLESENPVHHSTVDIHTLEVVENLKTLPEFQNLPPQYQPKVELAAYLHDIGKGPKARWAKNGGVQKADPDHPVRAMPMMVKILTEQVGKVEQGNVELLLKLVCYHDLVGEVLGKGRNERQIVDIASSTLELDMLFALGKADATVLADWWDDDEAKALYERCRAAIESRGGM